MDGRVLGQAVTDAAALASEDGRAHAPSRDDLEEGIARHGPAVGVADPAHPRLLGPPLSAGAGAVFSLAFSANGHTLASGTHDGATRLWNLNVGYAIQHICTTAGGLTRQQWHEYLPQLPYQPFCAH